MRRLSPLLIAFALAIGAAACSSGSDEGGPSQTDGPTEAPKDPKEAAERFLRLWDEERYKDMYDLLSTESRLDIDLETFAGRYEAIRDEATITGIDHELLPDVTDETVEVRYKVTIHTSFFGDINETNAMPLVQETVTGDQGGGSPGSSSREWRVQWTPSLIFRDLDDRSLVHLFTRVPRRGAIYDRNGAELAIDAQLAVVGVVPDLITDLETVVATLSQMLGMPADEVRAKVAADVPSYYFVPVKTLDYGTPEAELDKYRALVDMGVVLRDETRRLYPQGESAAHVIGYMTEVTAEQLETLEDEGYEPGDKIGAFGLERDMNDLLAGDRGGLLATVTPEGTISAQIAEKPAKAGKDLYLCIDINVQKKAEAELGERVGSIVAMDPSDNCVLALASYPRFDPNAFYRGLTQEEADKLFNDPRQPFLHRPLLAEYPPGSTFKVVTTAAGLEKGGVSPGDTFHCLPVWDKLGEDFEQKNWQTIDRGWLTPAEGLMASCNPVFFDMAVILDDLNSDYLPEMARAMGFGSPTGIGLDEAEGVVPDPEWKGDNIGDFWYTGDAVNMSIGQGYVLATPLQIANMYSAISETGVLRKPLLVKAIGEAGLSAVQEQEAEVINPLPVSQGTLDTIRHGMELVIQNPGGTSYNAWLGTSVCARGKSGTAEDTAYGADHVFFVAYANCSDPQIMAIAALEEGKSGSAEAGPMVRHILEAYINGALVSNP